MPSRSEQLAGQVKTWLDGLTLTGTPATSQVLGRVRLERESSATRVVVQPAAEERRFVARDRSSRKRHEVRLHVVVPAASGAEPDDASALLLCEELLDEAESYDWATNASTRLERTIRNGELGDGALTDADMHDTRREHYSVLSLIFEEE